MSREEKCKSCGEYHPSNTLCPPHEVRMKSELGEQPDKALFKAWQDRAMKAEAEIKAKDEQIKNLNEQSKREKKRLEKALKEQGFTVGPFVNGPDIRD